MKAKKLSDLPVPESGSLGTRLNTNGISLTLKFRYGGSGTYYVCKINFEDIVAYRFRKERYSLGFISEAYESLAEILDSPWCSELNYDGRHFAVFLSSNGYFEVLGKSFRIGEPEKIDRDLPPETWA